MFLAFLSNILKMKANSKNDVVADYVHAYATRTGGAPRDLEFHFGCRTRLASVASCATRPTAATAGLRPDQGVLQSLAPHFTLELRIAAELRSDVRLHSARRYFHRLPIGYSPHRYVATLIDFNFVIFVTY